MANKLYNVTLTWEKTKPKMTELEPIFSGLGDWLRMSNSSWFVWTDKAPIPIYNALRSELHSDDRMLVIPVDPGDFYGWAPQWVWDWFNAKRAAQSSASYFGDIDLGALNAALGLTGPKKT